MDVGNYVMRIQRSPDNPDELSVTLSWNDNGRVQHEGSVPTAEFVEAMLELTED